MARPADPHAKIDLLRAAEAVFVERGLDDAKVEEITRRAGHSKGAFYLHFGSKEEAFRQIVETLVARLESCLDDSQALMSGDKHLEPASYAKEWHEKDLEVFEFVWQNRGVMRLCLQGGGSVQFIHLIDEFAERSRRNTKLFLEWGKRHDLFRHDVDAEVASLMISGAYDRVAREVVRSDRKPDLARITKHLQRLIIGAVGSPAFVAIVDPQVIHARRPNGHGRASQRGAR